jgi:hypothetical protein
MARSKYEPEIVEIILNAIRDTGGDRPGWEAGGISKDTFYEWINRYPDFSDQVKRAKLDYRNTCPDVLVRQAKQALSDYLFGRMERVQVTEEERVSEEGLTSYKKVTRRVTMGVPRWAIERVLGKPADLIEALKVLADCNVIPQWLVQRSVDEIGSARKGITEAIAGVLPDVESRSVQPGLSAETAAAIRAQILGIQPASFAALPGEVDSGSESGEDL